MIIVKWLYDYHIYQVTSAVRPTWHSAVEPVCPSDDVPRQNRHVRPTTFHGRTGLEIRGPVHRVSGPRPIDGLGFFFFRQSVEVLKFEILSVGFQDLDRQTDKVFFFFFFPALSGGLPKVNTRVFFFHPFQAGCPGLILGFFIYLI
jgi:hypothetical protein